MSDRQILLVLFLWLSPSIAPAQELAWEAAPTSVASDFIISKRVDEVNLLLSVTDSKGRFVSNVKQEELQILDNHQPPEKWNYFQSRTNLPLRVALMIDVSSSIRDRFRFEQQAATAFLRRILRPAIDQAEVVSFGTEIKEVQSMTSDLSKLARAIHDLQPGGETAMYDAVRMGCDRLMDNRDVNVVRKVIILITDGADTRSQATIKGALQAALKSEAVILALDSNIASERHSKGAAVLEQLARSSGGFVLPATEKSDLKQAFRSAEIFLRNQYALGYKPLDFKANGSFHSIEVITRRRRLRVHSRNGYYAPLN